MWETPLFVLLAVVGGLVGALFNHINAKVRDGLLKSVPTRMLDVVAGANARDVRLQINKWRRDRTTGRPFLRMFEAVAIAAITAVLAFWAPYFLSKCHLIPEAVRRPPPPPATPLDRVLTTIAFACDSNARTSI